MRLLITLFISSCILVTSYAQLDTTIYTYNIPNTTTSIVTHLTPYDEGYLIALHNENNEQDFSSIILTDLNLVESTRIAKLEVDGLQIHNISYAEKYEDGFLCFANVQNETQNKFVSFLISSDLSTVSLIDTLTLDFNTRVFFRKFKKNESLIESFGSIHDLSSDDILENIYLSINEVGQFQTLKKIIFPNNPKIITNFVYHPIYKQYFITLFGRESVLLNSELQILDYLDNYYVTEYDNITYHNRFNIYGCHYTDNLECIGLGIRSIFRISVIDWNWLESSIAINSILPVTPQGSEYDIATVESIVDGDNNLFVVAWGLSIFFNDEVEPNTIYVSKYNKDRELEWHIPFKNGNEFYFGGIEVDDNNNLLIFGMMNSGNDAIQKRNFLLKIASDGDILSNVSENRKKENFINVFPNPATSNLNIKLNSTPCTYSIYHSSGVLVKQGVLHNSLEHIDITGLPSGFYNLVCEIENEKIALQKFIKH